MLKELIEIMKIEDTEDRIIAVSSWIASNVETLELNNKVIKMHFNSEESDTIKYYMAQQMSEILIEKHAVITNKNNNINLKVTVLKR